MNIYGEIGSARLLNIKVILDDNQLIYEGTIENAPDEIKRLKYSKIDMTNPMTYYVYSEFN